MFDTSATAEPYSARGGWLPVGEFGPEPYRDVDSAVGLSFDREFESAFADGFWDAPADGGAPPPRPTMATCAPSGWSALELDSATKDPARLSDAEVVEAIVGFDRISSWAVARQARLIAELARRRPADPVPNEDRTSVGSRFVPDEVGVALTLARGTAAGRPAGCSGCCPTPTPCGRPG